MGRGGVGPSPKSCGHARIVILFIRVMLQGIVLCAVEGWFVTFWRCLGLGERVVSATYDGAKAYVDILQRFDRGLPRRVVWGYTEVSWGTGPVKGPVVSLDTEGTVPA